MAKRTAEEAQLPGGPQSERRKLHTLVQGQIESIDSFQNWLDSHIAEAPNCQEIVSTIIERLDSCRNWVLGAEQTLSWPDASEAPSWGPIRYRRTGTDINSAAFAITGPAPRDRFEISAAGYSESGPIERFFGYVCEMSENLAAGEVQIKRLIQIIAELEELQVGSPTLSAKSHIRLLQQYNDVKDVSQQLIGLIAENKGVSIGSLYQSGEYGVTPED